MKLADIRGKGVSPVSSIRTPLREQSARAKTMRRGVGLVELLIALAIVAALLTATAAAVNAAFKAYAVNQTQADTSQRTRLALHRITGILRTAAEHAPVTAAQKTLFVKGQRVTDSGVAVLDQNGMEIRFTFDDAAHALIVSEGGRQHVLLEGVREFSVTMDPRKSAAALKTGGGYDLLARATISLTAGFTAEAADLTAEQGDSRTVTFTASVTPRRTAW